MQQKSMRKKAIEVQKQHDTSPFLDQIEISKLPGFKVIIAAKANDDKGLSAITMGILDKKGFIVSEQNLSYIGKTWKGSSKPFKLKPGNYTAVVIAVDTANNRSQERRSNFILQKFQPQ